MRPVYVPLREESEFGKETGFNFFFEERLAIKPTNKPAMAFTVATKMVFISGAPAGR